MIRLGSYGFLFFQRPLKVSIPEIRTHAHVIGVSGSGKSRFLASLYLELYEAGLSSTLVDPHGDLARLVLAHLVKRGVYQDPGAYEKILYLDIPAGERASRYLPLNVLAQHGSPYAVASNIKEAFHRAWPQLAHGAAPMFDTLVQDGVKVLMSNHLPLTSLYRLLTDKAFRDDLLAREQDRDVIAFFHDQFDRLSVHDQADQAGAALRRAHLLTFSPVLRYSLGQSEMLLDYRKILDTNTSLIVNLATGDAEARRLLGCLLTVIAEQGALSRADVPPEKRPNTHHMVIDEFSEFTAQSEEALARILSLTRKYGLYLVMAHQTWSQASSRLQGALQNVGLEVVFKLGRSDAQQSAMVLGRVDPMEIKHEVPDEHAVDRTHPVFYSLPEQWETWVQAIQDLHPRTAFVRQQSGKVSHIHTVKLPDPQLRNGELEAVEAEYLRRYFKVEGDIKAEMERASKGPDLPPRYVKDDSL